MCKQKSISLLFIFYMCVCTRKTMDTLLRAKLVTLYLWRKAILNRRRAEKKKNNRRRFWIRPLYQQRNILGAGTTLVEEMRDNPHNLHNNFFRMSSEAFDRLLSLVGHHIAKCDSRREPISPHIRLSITLRYLASGDSMTSLTYLFRVGKATISNIISETLAAIWNVLMPVVLVPPTEEEWKKISEQFEQFWNFPNCIGALDGKHVTIQENKQSDEELDNFFTLSTDYNPDMNITDSDEDADDIGYSECSPKWRKANGGRDLHHVPRINIASLVGQRDQKTMSIAKYEEGEGFEDDASSVSMSPLKVSVQSDDSDGEVESLDDIRRRNVERMTAFINSLRNPELEAQFAMNRNLSSAPKPPKRSRKTNVINDFSKKYNIPVELRKSARLQNKKPVYFEGDLDNIVENVRNVYNKRNNYNVGDYYIEDLEEIVYQPRGKRPGIQKKTEDRVIIPVAEVTQAMLDNIAVRVKTKVYSQNGTTCHQCRQKTTDQKTCCRNPECIGIQGMFCGVCIKNRYGEDCAKALLDPNWTCPVCRGKCNCSICRNKQGKRPTGVLTPLAIQQGYKCVDDLLKNLRGEGDKPEEDHIWALARDPEALLGFSDDGRKMHFPNDKEHSMACRLCILTDCEKPDNLLGFSEDGTVAIMGNHKHERLLTLND